MRRAFFRFPGDEAWWLQVGSFAAMTSRVPRGPIFGYGRVAVSSRHDQPPDARLAAIYSGLVLVVGGRSFCVLRRLEVAV